jgi:hypothetical protein
MKILRDGKYTMLVLTSSTPNSASSMCLLTAVVIAGSLSIELHVIFSRILNAGILWRRNLVLYKSPLAET